MNRRSIRSLFYGFLTLFSIITFFPVKLSAQNTKFKALFIYNFTKLIEWPNESSKEFKIMVLGSSDLTDELKEISKKTAGARPILPIDIKFAENLDEFQIVFVAKNRNAELGTVLRNVKGKHTLVITEAEGSCSRGAGINFITKNGSLNFEISKNNITSSGLKISNNLLSIGILVN